MVAGGILFGGLMVLVSSRRALSSLESTLFQIISLGLGIAGSYMLGVNSAEAAAADVIRPHARSAFRRVLSLYRAFQRLGTSIEVRRGVLSSIAQQDGGIVVVEHIESSLDVLAAQVLEQIGTANDAMEDWKDLVPEEVAEIEAQAAKVKQDESGQPEGSR